MGKEDNEAEETPKGSITRREFLKYSAGVAVVAAGASALLGGLPLPSSETVKSTPRSVSSDRLVVMVNGDELTVMNGDNEVKVKDSGLASAIAGKLQ